MQNWAGSDKYEYECTYFLPGKYLIWLITIGCEMEKF